jgi:opine dehydrogenase
VTVASRSVVVLGGDGVARVVAGRLALGGHKVVLWEAPSAQGSGVASGERLQIRLSGAGGDAVATLAAATADPFEALAAGDVLLTCAPPHAQEKLAGLVLPLIEPRHTLVLLSGGLSSLAHAKWLRDRGRVDLPTLVTSDTAPFFACRLAPDRLHVSAVAANVGFGVFPSCRTEAAMNVLEDLFPGAWAHAHVVAAALAAVEPFLRAPAVLMSCGIKRRPRPGASLFDDAFSPAVARVAEVLDGERLALAAALGLDLPTAAESLHAWGLSPRGDLWSAVHGSFALTQTPDAEARQAGQLADDATFGLRPWVELGENLGVPMPLAQSLLAVHDAAIEVDSRHPGWSLDGLDIAGLSAAMLGRFLAAGGADPVI